MVIVSRREAATSRCCLFFLSFFCSISAAHGYALPAEYMECRFKLDLMQEMHANELRFSSVQKRDLALNTCSYHLDLVERAIRDIAQARNNRLQASLALTQTQNDLNSESILTSLLRSCAVFVASYWQVEGRFDLTYLYRISIDSSNDRIRHRLIEICEHLTILEYDSTFEVTEESVQDLLPRLESYLKDRAVLIRAEFERNREIQLEFEALDAECKQLDPRTGCPECFF